MKRSCGLLALFFCVSIASSQDLSKFNQYEAQKKDKATALVYSLVIPGAGLFYTERYWAGIASLTGTVLVLAAIDEQRTDDPVAYAVVFVVLKLIDIGFAFGEVEDYNYNIRKQLNFSLSPQSQGATFTVTINF